MPASPNQNLKEFWNIVRKPCQMGNLWLVISLACVLCFWVTDQSDLMNHTQTTHSKKQFLICLWWWLPLRLLTCQSLLLMSPFQDNNRLDKQTTWSNDTPRLKALTLKAIYIQIYYPQAWFFFKLTTQSIASYPGKTLTLQVSIWKHVLRNEQSPRDSK